MKNTIIDKFYELLFPENITCNFCGEDCDKQRESGLCLECVNKLPFNNKNICFKCGNLLREGESCNVCKFTKHYFVKARAPFVYEGNVKEAIFKLKFNGERYIAKTFAYYLSLSYHLLNENFDIIVPLPLSAKRLKERGYNQSELIAKELSKIVGVECKLVLDKVVHTPKQSNVEITERSKNVENVFKVNSVKDIKNKSILLIDDIFTTGATVNSASRELMRKGARSVYVLTVAHTRQKSNVSN